MSAAAVTNVFAVSVGASPQPVNIVQPQPTTVTARIVVIDDRAHCVVCSGSGVDMVVCKYGTSEKDCNSALRDPRQAFIVVVGPAPHTFKLPANVTCVKFILVRSDEGVTASDVTPVAQPRTITFGGPLASAQTFSSIFALDVGVFHGCETNPSLTELMSEFSKLILSLPQLFKLTPGTLTAAEATRSMNARKMPGAADVVKLVSEKLKTLRSAMETAVEYDPECPEYDPACPDTVPSGEDSKLDEVQIEDLSKAIAETLSAVTNSPGAQYDSAYTAASFPSQYTEPPPRALETAGVLDGLNWLQNTIESQHFEAPQGQQPPVHDYGRERDYRARSHHQPDRPRERDYSPDRHRDRQRDSNRRRGDNRRDRPRYSGGANNKRSERDHRSPRGKRSGSDHRSPRAYKR